MKSVRKGDGWLLGGLVAVAVALPMATIVSIPSPLLESPTSVVAYSTEGELIAAQIASDGQWRFPLSDSVPERYARALVAYEDKRFWEHNGVDLIAIARAVRADLAQGRVAQGASTITMQVARMAYGNRARTVGNKLLEMMTALGLELTQTKEEILALYAANAPMGGNIVGLQAASWRYFGRRPCDLTWAESALLAVLPNAPARVHVARNRERLKSKRDRLLLKLFRNGDIDRSTYELSVAEPLPTEPHPINNRAPQLLNRLATRYRGQSETTISAMMQSRVQAIADQYSERYALNRINDIGVLVAEIGSGDILAYVGNASRESPTSMVDNVTSERSTGSTLKPILYATMLTSGEMTPRRIWADTPLDINGFTPQNYNHDYRGAVHADEALTRSLNVPLVRMLTVHNIGRFLSDLRQIGATTMTRSQDYYGASLILGGAETTLLDLCGMYANMARHLNHYNEDPSVVGRPLEDYRPLRLTREGSAEVPERQASATLPSPAAIWHTFEAMSNLSRPEEEADWQTFSSMKRVAWKTGTSFGGRDAWAVGLTPTHVVGVWVGNSTGEGRAGLTGVGYAAPVMFDVFTMLRGGRWFEEPYDDEEEVVVCRSSGMVASGVCGEVDTVRLPRACVDAGRCRYCRLVHLSEDGKWQVNTSCASASGIRTESRFVLPARMEYYYRRYHTDYEVLPPVRSDCATSSQKRIAVIYPHYNQTIVRTRAFDGTLQGVVCEAAAPQGVTLYWHLDDEYLTSTTGEHQVLVSPSVGEHRLTIVSGDGQTSTVLFRVE